MMTHLVLLAILCSSTAYIHPFARPVVRSDHPVQLTVSRSQSFALQFTLKNDDNKDKSSTTDSEPILSPSSLEQTKSLALSSFIGLIVGLSVVAFKESISVAQTNLVIFDSYFIPILGGLIVSVLAYINSLTSSSSDPLTLFDSTKPLSSTLRAPPSIKTTALKTLAAVATLSTGNSLGPEGPVVELGGALGRTLGGNSNLVAAGAAAGISAGFNAPLAGVFFAVEVVNNNGNDSGNTTSQGLTCVLISSTIAALVSGLLLNDSLAFDLLTPMVKENVAEVTTYVARRKTDKGETKLNKAKNERRKR